MACGDDPGGTGPDPDPEPMQAEVDSYLSNQPAWAAVSQQVSESADPVKGDPQGPAALVDVGDPNYDPQFVCTATPYSLAKNPEKIVTMTADAGLLVPGMLLQGRSHVVGSLQELPISQRAPITIVINATGVGTPSRVVDSPSLGTLQTAVNAIIQEAETSAFGHSSLIEFSQVTSRSQEQAALGLGISGRYLGGSAKASMASRTSASETTVTASFTQNAFSIRVQRPDLPSQWFTDEFTQEVLDQQIQAGQIGPDNLPLYVSEVTYGRIVIVNFSSSESSSAIEGMFQASINGGVGSMKAKLTAEQQQMVSNASIQVVSLGGPAEGGFQFAKEILTPDDPTTIGLDGFFAQNVELTTFVPISYTLSDLRTGETAKVGEISEYEVLECEPIAEDILSEFEEAGNEEGWAAIGARHNNGNNPDPRIWIQAGQAQVGNGYLYVGDNPGPVGYFIASEKYRGNKSAYVGGTLSYWIEWEKANDPGTPLSSMSYPDVEIRGVGTPLVLAWSAGLDDWPQHMWSFRELELVPQPSLRVYVSGQGVGSAVEATAQDIEEVLADVASIRIRGEYRNGGGDYGNLDHVLLKPKS